MKKKKIDTLHFNSFKVFYSEVALLIEAAFFLDHEIFRAKSRDFIPEFASKKINFLKKNCTPNCIPN